MGPNEKGTTIYKPKIKRVQKDTPVGSVCLNSEEREKLV